MNVLPGWGQRPNDKVIRTIKEKAARRGSQDGQVGTGWDHK